MGVNLKTSDSANLLTNRRFFHEFFAPITPQHNIVVQHKNRTLQEMARAMMHARFVFLQL